MERYNNIIEKLEKYGQTHLLRFYDELTEDEKEVLLRQIDSVDFEEIKNITSCNNTCDNKENSSFSNNEISPIDVVDKYELNEEEKQNYTQIGEDLIKKGKVAVCTMAGGQGSRLGHDGPKGTFVVPLKTPKSIFQISTEHLLDAYKKYGNYINWYIMTSEDNDAVTRKYFEENNYFGYSKEHVKFFKQGELPLLSFDGKILSGKLSVYDAAYLVKLVHQILLIVKTACSVNYYNITASGLGSRQTVKHHGCRVAAFLVAHNVTAGALSPDGKLLGGCSAEGITCAEKHTLSLLTKLICKLTDGCGLAYTVYAHHQNNGGPGFKLKGIILHLQVL